MASTHPPREQLLGGDGGGRDLVHQPGPVEQLIIERRELSAVSNADYARAVIRKACEEPERRRRRLVARRRMLIEDAWKSLLADDIRNRSHLQLWQAIMGANGERADISRNAARDIWREEAVLYKSPARRSFAGDDSGDEIAKYLRLTRRFFHVFWQQFEFELSAFNDLLIYPTVVSFRGRKIIRHNILAGDDCSVVFDRELAPANADPLQPYSVVAFRGWGDDMRILYIDPNWRFVFDPHLVRRDHATDEPLKDSDAGTPAPNGKEGWQNPYGELPFEFVHRNPFRSEFWDQTSGDDLVSLTLKLGRFETDTDSKAFRSGHKQVVVVGETVEEPKATLADIAHVLQLKGDAATAFVADFQLDIEGRERVADAWEARGAASRGIRFRPGPYQTAEQARLSERGLTELRLRKREVVAEAEQGYYYLCARTASVHGLPESFDPTAELSVEHAPIEYPGDPAAELDIVERRSRLLLSSIVDRVLAEHPGWTRDKAVGFLRDNAEELAEIQRIKQGAGVPENDLGNRSADDERAGALGPAVRDGQPRPPAA